jgi:hypothetical protein
MSLAKLRSPYFKFLRLGVDTKIEAINEFIGSEGSVLVDANTASIIWADDSDVWELEHGDVMVSVLDTIQVFGAAEFTAAFEEAVTLETADVE